MKYLQETRVKERDENYEHLVGERRQQVHERVNEVLDRGGSRSDVEDVVLGELMAGRITDELRWYAEGFCRGLFGDGDAYKAESIENLALQPTANKHNHLGYSAGMVVARGRELERFGR